MAYRDDLIALGAVHLYPFDGNANDIIGTSNGTVSGTAFGGAQICEDATQSLVTNGRSDRVALPDTATLTGAQTAVAVGVWFQTSAIQDPPCAIFGDGGATQGVRVALSFGNSVLFEADLNTIVLQIYADRDLVPNRPYHLLLKVETTVHGNIFNAYLDGVPQLSANPSDRQPGVASIGDRDPFYFGDPPIDSPIGGDLILLVAPVNGNYSMSCHWDGANAAALTDTDIREICFERGALPDVTITQGSEAVMQAQLDLLASTVRPDVPLCIRVEDVLGGGALNLSADNITFDERASIHVQWMGTGTLSWTNTNGSNASIGSTPNGGSIDFIESVPITVSAIDASDSSPIMGANVQLVTDGGGPAAAGVVVAEGLTDALGELTTSYPFVSDQGVVGRARKASASPIYATGALGGTITASGGSFVAVMQADE